jgi:hypothetical protein
MCLIAGSRIVCLDPALFIRTRTQGLLAFLFPDNQQESREYPKLFDAGSKIGRFDPAILSWRFRRVPYIQSLDLLQTSNAAFRENQALGFTRHPSPGSFFFGRNPALRFDLRIMFLMLALSCRSLTTTKGSIEM